MESKQIKSHLNQTQFKPGYADREIPMSSAFDAERFMNSALDAPNDAVYVVCPAGEYLALIDKVDKPRAIESQKNPGQVSYALDITWNIQDDKVKADLGREKLTCRQTLWLDINDSGSLEMGKGKNIALGQLREALGMNTGKFSFTSLEGAGPARVIVKNSTGKDGQEFANVTKVGAA